MGSDMKEITEIPVLPPEIIEAVRSEKFAVFIGAGVSRSVGCLGWNELALNLLNRCEEEGLINNFEKESMSRQSDFKKIITICNHLLNNDDRFFAEMEKALNDTKVSKTNPNLEKIYKPLFRLDAIFVTTNADRHINQLFTPQQIVSKNFEKDMPISNKYLYKIHGCIENQRSLVFTVNEYLEQYANNNEFQGFLERLFNECTILFIGYGLGEFEQIYFGKLGITLIPYAKDEKGYTQLEDIVQKWVAEIESQTRKIVRAFDFIDDALGNPI
ncbi:MAG: SIR2 family protein [Campylobacterales bacterium]